MWRAAIMQLSKLSATLPPAPAAAAMLPHASLSTSRSLGAAAARLSAPAQGAMWARLPRSYSATAAPSTALAQDFSNMQAQAYAPQGGQEEPAVIHEVDWSVNNNNYISLIGNLTGDPEIRQLATGSVVAKMRVAHRTPQKLTEYYSVDAWGSWAEGIRSAGLRKGQQILVEGRLRTDEWADKATGQPRQAVRVVASQVSTVRPYNATGQQVQQQQLQLQQPAAVQAAEWTQYGAQPPPPCGEWGADDQTAGAFGAPPPPPQPAPQQARGGSGPKDAAWEAYFANPSGYWDNRAKKLNPKAPDFKNKTTNEALWLNGAPGWVAPELERQDGGAPAQEDLDTPPF